MINITKMLTTYNYSSATNRQIKYIVIHYFGALGTAKNTATYFANAYRGASAHYCVDESSIYQCVEDKNISWHCGGDYYYHDECRNSNSIGIEVRPLKVSSKTLNASDKDWYFTEKTIQNTVDLVKMLMKKYNVPLKNVIRHYDVTHKWCPRPFMGTDTNTYYKTTGEIQWSKFKARLKEEEIDMTKEEVIKLINSEVIKVVGAEIEKNKRMIAELKDVPANLQSEVKVLLDTEAINGGTVASVNANDINMPYEILRSNIIAKRYTDGEIKEIKNQLDELSQKIDSIQIPEIKEMKMDEIIAEIQRRLAE